MTEQKQNWYAVYTRARWEKKVYKLLVEKEIESYCPVNRVKKKWSDRLKWVEEPLFSSYVFVRVSEAEQTRVRNINGVVNFVYWLGKPAIVQDKEIEIIRKFLDDYHDVQAIPLDLRANDAVVIRKGAFMDKRGKIVRILHNKVQVIIESIGYCLTALVDKSNVAMHR